MKITAYNNGVWKDYIYCSDDSCFNRPLSYLVTRKNTNSSVELTNNDVLFLLYPVKLQTCSFHAMCFRVPRVSYKTERTAADYFECAV